MNRPCVGPPVFQLEIGGLNDDGTVQRFQAGPAELAMTLDDGRPGFALLLPNGVIVTVLAQDAHQLADLADSFNRFAARCLMEKRAGGSR